MAARDSESARLKEGSSASTLHTAVERWAEDFAESNDSLLRVGIFGSDPDSPDFDGHANIVVVLQETDIPLSERSTSLDLTAIPVSTQALVYTDDEWNEMIEEDGWLARRMRDIRWAYET